MKLTDSTAAYVGTSVARAIASISATLHQFQVYADTSLSQVLSGAIGLVKKGLGTLTLSNTNTYSGNAAIDEGILSITTSSALPGYNTNGRWAAASGATLAVYNAVTDAEITTLRGTTNFKAGSNLGFDTTSGNRSYTPVISNTSQGALGLVKLGANQLTLGGANTYTGPTIVLTGTLATNAANLLPDASAVTIASGATLQLGGADTLATLAGAGTMLCGANALTLNSANSASFAGTFSNTAGTFTKTGTGTQGLTGTSTLAAGIQLTGGTLELAGTFTQTAAAAPRNTQLAVNSAQTATLRLISGSATLTGLFFGENNGGSATVNVNGGTLTVNGQTWQTGVVSSLNINGGSFVSQQFDIGGGTTVSTTSTVTLASGSFSLANLFRWGEGGAAGYSTTSVFHLDGGTFTSGNTWQALKGSNTFNFNGGIFSSSSTTLNITTGLLISFMVKSGGAVFDIPSGYANTFSPNLITDATSTGGGFTKQGAGTLTFGGTGSTYTGQSRILEGVLVVTNANNNSANGVFGNNTLPIILGSNGKTATLSLPGGVSTNKNITLATGSTCTLITPNTTLNGNITGTAPLTIGTGSGQTNLSGINTFSGGLTMTAGTIQPTNNSAIGTGQLIFNGSSFRAYTSPLTFTNSILFNANANFTTIANERSLTFSGPVTLTGNRTLSVYNGTSVAGEALIFSGVIGDGGNGYGITVAQSW